MGKPKAVEIVDGRIVQKRTITEMDLMAVETCRAQIAAMVAELEGAKVRLGILEQDVKDRLAAGCRIVGRMTAMVTEETGPRRPPWKDIYLDHMHCHHNVSIEAEEQRVITETMGKPREVLVIGVKPGKAM